jgi:glycosyltransferase involved in cell wall biosynthesis
MRGGEKVLEALCDIFPDADIITHVVDRNAVSDKILSHNIKTTFISKLPMAKRLYQSYLPLMPLALEQVDMREYDLVISCESGPAKGIIPAPNALHVCYCHSPMRYVWNMYHDYRASAGLLSRITMPFLTHYLRNWDQGAAARVDAFIANSHAVAERIMKYYRRESTVIHPPVDLDTFSPVAAEEVGEDYVMVGELVRYKRPDLAVEAFNRSGKRLVVMGGGQMLNEIRQMAGPTVDVRGAVGLDELHYRLARAKALVFPGEEDFGIVPVEALACGRPVIAFGRGGALDTVVDGVTGITFNEPTVESLLDAITRFEAHSFDTGRILRFAATFSRERFCSQIEEFIGAKLAERSRGRRPPVHAAALGPIGNDTMPPRHASGKN